MDENQAVFNFQLPRKVLEKLREEAKRIGVPVSAIIKMRISKGDFVETKE
jgi:hypothetical protein